MEGKKNDFLKDTIIEDEEKKQGEDNSDGDNQINSSSQQQVTTNLIKEIPSASLKEKHANQIKELEQLLADIKLDSDEKQTLKVLMQQNDKGENENYEEICKFVAQLKKTKRNRFEEKKLEKISTLFDTHDFWDSQPVPKVSDLVSDADYDKPIDRLKTVDEIQSTPYEIPAGFYWANVNIENEEECKEVYDLLTQNYVEDDDAMFRFDYSLKFIQWALNPPGYKKDWLFGVRGGKKNKLFGFISGIPVHISVNGKKMVMAEINFLCVHKQLRTKKLAPVLIKEITRRVNKCDIWQAVYTAGVVIPTPITAATYYHRSLNPQKLVETGFSSLPQNTPLARYVKLNKLPNQSSLKGIRQMEERDVKQVTSLLNKYLSTFKLHIIFSEEEVKHFLVPQEDVIESYVVEKDDQITDFVSFYKLPSSCLKHPVHRSLHVAYSFYTVPGQFTMTELMKDALILARNKGYDVFNALDITQNLEFFQELKFHPGDGNLNYYLYNWRIQKIKPQDVGITLV